MMLNNISRSTIRVGILGLFLLVGFKQAEALPVCQTGSLADYIALDSSGGCTSDNLTFFRFAYTPAPVGTGGASLATAADITLTPLSSSVGVGFSISSPFFTLSNSTVAQSATYTIGYSADPPPIIIGQGLSLDPPFGNVLVTQNVCANDVLANNCALGVLTSQSVTPPSPSSNIYFGNPVPFVDVQTIINLQATPGNPAGFDSVQTGELLTIGANAPEPSTVGLSLCTLIIGLAGTKLRQLRRK